MARTLSAIKQDLTTALLADPVLSTKLTSTSAVAVYNLWLWIVAAAIWAHENLFDAHKAEIDAIIAAQRAHTPRWYKEKCKAFQYGDQLPDGEDVYAVIDPAKQVVAYAAAVEVVTNNNVLRGMRLKIAGINTGLLQPITAPQLAALKTYMELVRDAGVRLYYTNAPADRLVADIAIYYDDLVLDNTGARRDGSNPTPVQSAFSAYLNRYYLTNFNGLFVVNQLIEYLQQQVEGVRICMVNNMQASHGVGPLTPFTTEYLPDAGYMSINTGTDLNITFIPHAPF